MANAVRDARGRRPRELQPRGPRGHLRACPAPGKSSAMNVFEDAGYFCVDNLPAEMIRSLAELFMHEGSKVERAAVVCDSRGGEYLPALAGVIDQLAAAGRRAPRRLPRPPTRRRCSTRYKETRRRHPLAPHGQRGRRHPRASRSCSRRCAQRGGHRDRHLRAQSAAALRRKVADELLEPRRARPARGHVHVLRPQARPAARRRPRVRRALPAQPALRRRPAAADRLRPADRRLRRPRRPPRGVLRARHPAARVPAPAVRRRGQGAPDGRDRLHRRPPPLGGHRRAPRRACSATATELLRRGRATATSTGFR